MSGSVNCPLLSVVLASAFALSRAECPAQEIDPGAKNLLSEEKMIRERALETFIKQSLDERRRLAHILEKAAKEHKVDDRYMSPLHVAILAVENCRVFEAESSLFSVIDYQLDVRSLPDGLVVSGDFFYPAAATLVSLHVDTKKVVNAMLKNVDDRQLQLLTWMLFRRAGSADNARRILRRSE